MVTTGHSQALYEDAHCKLSKEKLTIKTYFFPFAQEKTIDTANIKHVYYKKQRFPADCFRAKDWGMTLTPIWWACDFARGLRGSNSNHYNVVIDTGTKIMKGFSVTNIDEFLYHMSQLLGYSIFHANTIPSYGNVGTTYRID
uniref:Peptidase A1 domain-containing protein n=1 Tax=Parascaris univalens TaxID=6257 RepID=A0A915AA92_PARUN